MFSISNIINNGNRTEKSNSDFSITNMITGKIGRHYVLLPIDHNHYNFPKSDSFI